MNMIEYVDAAQSTKSSMFFQPNFSDLPYGGERPDPLRITVDVLHAIVGISTEGGELLDVAKKAMFYGKPVDYVNLDEEMGDILWYVAIYCKARGVTIEQLAATNIAKLRARYPDQFTQHDAQVRDLARERAVLEQQTELNLPTSSDAFPQPMVLTDAQVAALQEYSPLTDREPETFATAINAHKISGASDLMQRAAYDGS